jgi:hypothetical protein
VSTTAIPDRFTTLPDEPALQATVVALEEHGFSIEVAGDLGAARQAVLACIPEGSSVMTNTSVTLDQAGLADAINDGGGRYDSARNKMFALDFATQAQQMKAIGGQPDYALGSVHAITRDGTLVIASASGSQLASYQHSLPLEDARAQAAYGAAQPGREDPGDTSGNARAYPCRPHPPASRLLSRLARSAADARRWRVTLNAMPAR